MKKIHFIGIGGIGMSGLASILLERGMTVSGSDPRPNNLTDDLEKKGALIYAGHSSSNLADDVDLIVKTMSIKEDNPEILKAREMGKDVITRSELLARILREARVSVGVTGTHGKTTTSALISCIMEEAGKSPTVIVGGEMDLFKSNAKSGSDMIVAEVDESDGYFRDTQVTCAVLTNIEREHMEHFGSFENLVSAYRQFIGKVSSSGLIVYNGEDGLLSELVALSAARKVSFGIEGDHDITCTEPSHERSIEFDLIVSGEKIKKIKSPLVGRHNVMNILAALGACIENGADITEAAEAINAFGGVKRRFELVGEAGSVRVIEDYAHHPTELAAVIGAACDYSAGRVIAVFQPHRYSRTSDLAEEFTKCFYGADILVLTDIYSADEDPGTGPGIEDIYKAIDKDRFEKVELVKKEDIPDRVAGLVTEGDVVLVLGAGDIREAAKPVLEEIKKRS